MMGSARKNKKTRRLSKRSIATILLAVLLFGIAGYIIFDAWRANEEFKKRLAEIPVAMGDTSPEGRQQSEGRDETEVDDDTISSYVVSPDMPRLITIDKIGLKARVLQMGVNPDGSMQAPINIYDAGWYTGSAKPGTVGAAVIDAHASGPTRQGLFAYLNTLTQGDMIQIEMGDGAVYSYRVAYKETVPIDSVDMRKVMEAYGGAAEGLNLITCDGSWIKDRKTYSDRTIVYAVKI